MGVSSRSSTLLLRVMTAAASDTPTSAAICGRTIPAQPRARPRRRGAHARRRALRIFATPYAASPRPNIIHASLPMLDGQNSERRHEEQQVGVGPAPTHRHADRERSVEEEQPPEPEPREEHEPAQLRRTDDRVDRRPVTFSMNGVPVSRWKPAEVQVTEGRREADARLVVARGVGMHRRRRRRRRSTGRRPPRASGRGRSTRSRNRPDRTLASRLAPERRHRHATRRPAPRAPHPRHRTRSGPPGRTATAT